MSRKLEQALKRKYTYSALSVIRETRMKTTTRHLFSNTKLVKSLTISNTGETVEQSNSPHCWWGHTLSEPFGKQAVTLQASSNSKCVSTLHRASRPVCQAPDLLRSRKGAGGWEAEVTPLESSTCSSIAEWMTKHVAKSGSGIYYKQKK